MKLSVLAISHAKRALEPQSRDRVRLCEYAKQLQQYHVIVFTRKSEGFPPVQQDGNLTLYATNSSHKIAMLARAFRIGKQILEAGKGISFVVSSQDPFETSLIGRLLTYNTNHIHQVQIHGDVFNPRSYRSSLLQRLRVLYGKQVVTTTDVIRVVSNRIKKSLLVQGVAKEKIVVLPIQSNVQNFISIGVGRDLVIDEPLKLLYVGRLAPEKNVSLLVRACAKLQTHTTNFSLRIVGDGPEKKYLEELSSVLGLSANVTFVGWQDSVLDEMKQANTLCLSSDHEGWAMVLQEAAAAGLAIVTTDVGCVGEFVRDTHECISVPVGDVQAFAQGLQSLVDGDRRVALAAAAHARAKEFQISQPEYLRQLIASHVSAK